MRIHLILIVLFFVFTAGISAQEPIRLPDPHKTGGMPLMDCLNSRHSTREYKDQPLAPQQLSDLLWAADGINRPETGKRTAPNSRNRQEIDIYVVKEDGIFLYDHLDHALIPISPGDHRGATGKQEFVGSASLNLVYVADYARIGTTAEAYRSTSCINTGLIAQNVYLYCASAGLGSVTRGYFDSESLHQVLMLDEGQEVILTQSAGIIGE